MRCLRAASRLAVLAAAALVMSAGSALAQAAAPAASLCQGEMAEITPGSIFVNPNRGWQMEGRDLEIDVTIPDKARLAVCWRWQRLEAPAPFEPLAGVRVVRNPDRLVVSVPRIYDRPGRDAVAFTPDNAAPLADLRVIVRTEDGTTATDVVTALAVVAQGDYCNVPRWGAFVDSGAAVPYANKRWQPAGGEIEFAVNSQQKTIPTDAMMRPCFRWKLISGDPGPFSDTVPPRVLERQTNALRLAISVPDLSNKPDRFAADRQGTFAVLRLFVPLADVRLLIFDNALNPVVDVWTDVGITSVFFAAAIALTVAGLAFFALWLVALRRLGSVARWTNPILSLVATRRGFASLSQLQIMLWTFVVVGSAAYVIALSGDLIPITTGTLVLLGISGTAAVIAKAKNESDSAIAGATGQDAAAASMPRSPRWSDLVMDATSGRELDVTRIQMLYFTLVTAFFVVLKVVTSYEIPAIPEGFLILMGISNSVYVGSKFAGPGSPT